MIFKNGAACKKLSLFFKKKDTIKNSCSTSDRPLEALDYHYHGIVKYYLPRKMFVSRLYLDLFDLIYIVTLIFYIYIFVFIVL